MASRSPTGTGNVRKLFDKSLSNLATVGGFAIYVSAMFRGQSTTPANSLASMVHGKMIAHSRSIGAITRPSLVDHSGVLALARMIVEGMITLFYLREPVDESTWALRHLVLRLHATTIQIRSFRGRVSSEEQAAGYRAARESLLTQIKANSRFALLLPEQQERILGGQEIFVGGMRRAAQKTGAFGKEMFDAIYAYLSSHSHSAPLSYMSYKRVSVDYRNPVDYQYGLAGLGIEVAAPCLRRATLRFLDDCLQEHPELEKKLRADFVKEQREEDNHYDVLFD